jgi:hypothetical protein
VSVVGFGFLLHDIPSSSSYFNVILCASYMHHCMK